MIIIQFNRKSECTIILAWVDKIVYKKILLESSESLIIDFISLATANLFILILALYRNL